MQSVPAANVLDPAMGWALWLVGVFILCFAGAVIVRLIVRAVRALEKRSTVAEEVLLLSARVAQQQRDHDEMSADGLPARNAP